MTRYDLLTVASETRDAFEQEIEWEISDMLPGSTDHDRESMWLRVAFQPILARVLRDHGVDEDTVRDLRWMLAALTRLESSQGWDRGFDTARMMEARRNP